MGFSSIVRQCLTLHLPVRKNSFLGLFRYGPMTLAEIRICCDSNGVLSWEVVSGPDINYKKLFKKKFAEAEKDAIIQWNDGRRQAAQESANRLKRLQEKINQLNNKNTNTPKTNKILPALGQKTSQEPPKKFEKLKSGEYVEDSWDSDSAYRT
jgi:uncharacterized protein